jgi:hypothetical protein
MLSCIYFLVYELLQLKYSLIFIPRCLQFTVVWNHLFSSSEDKWQKIEHYYSLIKILYMPETKQQDKSPCYIFNKVIKKKMEDSEKSYLQTLSHRVVSNTPCHSRDPNSQLDW